MDGALVPLPHLPIHPIPQLVDTSRDQNPLRTHSCSASSSGVVAICGGSIPRSDDEASERSDGKIRYQRVGHAATSLLTMRTTSVCLTCASADGSVGSCPTMEFPTESNTKAEMLVKCQKHCKDEPQYGGLGLGSVAQTDDYYIGFQYQRPGITKCR